jgi:hypothetical protein
MCPIKVLSRSQTTRLERTKSQGLLYLHEQVSR